MKSDVEWEKVGKSEPYWGVLTFEKYKRKNLTFASRQEFFRSGEEYVKQLFETISLHFDNNFHPSLGIDFGCGVGRITIPLSKRCKEVIGIDVATSMIEEAKRNCLFFNVTNVHFGNDPSKIKQKADFVVTALVLQHIETEKGMQLFSSLIDLLNPMGIACIEVPFSFKMSPLRNVLSLTFRPIVNKSRLAQKFYNLLTKRDPNASFLIMNEYDVNAILELLLQKGLDKILILTNKYYTNTALISSAVLFIRK